MHKDFRVIEEDRQAVFALEPEVIQMARPDCVAPM
jgi:hypothetical protein